MLLRIGLYSSIILVLYVVFTQPSFSSPNGSMLGSSASNASSLPNVSLRSSPSPKYINYSETTTKPKKLMPKKNNNEKNELKVQALPTMIIEEEKKIEPLENYWFWHFFKDVTHDYLTYYSADILPYTAGLLVAAGGAANTNMDRSIQHYWQKKIKGRTSDNLLKNQEGIGLFPYVKLYVAAIVLGYLTENSTPFVETVYEWGYRSLRAMFIVSPQVTFLRRVLGGGRPNSKYYSDSEWRMFKRSRPSCSGHAFNGALPFLTAATMVDNRFYRYSLYILSTLPGLSRINDNKHYFSQVFLGWGLSFLAVKAVEISDSRRRESFAVGIVPLEDGAVTEIKFYF